MILLNILLIFIHTDSVYLYLAHIKNYQIVKQNIFYERSKSNAIRVNNPRLSFTAFGRHFELKLREDHSILSSETQIFLHQSEKVIKKNLSNFRESLLYEGTVDRENFSHIHGYFLRDVFVGRIVIPDGIYYSESAFQHLEESVYKDKALIYKAYDSKELRTIDKYHNTFKRNVENQNCQKILLDDPMPNLKSGKLCSIELMADYTLYEESHRDIKYTISRMLYHIKSADIIFRETDFDEDRFPDGVGFIVLLITINMDKFAHNSLFSDELEFPEYYLFQISLYHQKFENCLLVNFCQRQFAENVIGISYVPHERNGFISGICQTPFRYRNYIRTLNVLGITMSTHKNVLTKSTIDIALTHEFGHSFGSDHDSDEDPNCIVNDYLGKYILSEYATDGSMPNNKLFSLCSRKTINNVLNKKGWCLKTYKNEPFCGNGITESGEECDCGSISNNSCKEIDSCCTALYDEENKCKIRNDMGYECSPREHECCNDKCKFISSESNTTCYTHKPCEMHSTCNGISGICPPGKHVKDGTPCKGTQFTCKSGQCKSSVCQDHHLPLCQCSLESNHQCHVCCLDRFNVCKSASEFGYYSSDGRLYLKMEGSSCGEENICDRYGKCIPKIEVIRDVNHRIIYEALENLPTVLFICQLLTLILFLGQLFIKQLNFRLLL
ncbi:disintegrin and metalloproteinase domain-containing protein 10-like [Centruroides sculpturatus]|uniref:disintegrin and metalloproteinase domain-containing protein 10-like n=1 Tax=Centruroides sculpturatus TaxID=218467 RepID=UPI000C6C984A|nr:disintegrin and metalloproteinase domain-containing protein 10-like [Centruroides sculpturatus]XP_023213200.1 disintegrin and metalloproteinase domain-containing protein 10-like [Centruroides sculpturatus]